MGVDMRTFDIVVVGGGGTVSVEVATGLMTCMGQS